MTWRFAWSNSWYYRLWNGTPLSGCPAVGPPPWAGWPSSVGGLALRGVLRSLPPPRNPTPPHPEDFEDVGMKRLETKRLLRYLAALRPKTDL